MFRMTQYKAPRRGVGGWRDFASLHDSDSASQAACLGKEIRCRGVFVWRMTNGRGCNAASLAKRNPVRPTRIALQLIENGNRVRRVRYRAMVIPMAYLSILDGVRATAVLLVVVSHLLLQITNGAEPSIYSYRTMGRVGVGIFFVHTTLVLMASLARHGSAPLPFYIRRVFRIYPLSVAIVLLFALLQFAAQVPIDKGKLLSNLLLVQNITGDTSFPRPLWSLPYEVQMYLVLPALYPLIKTRRPLMWASFLWTWSVIMALALPSASLAYKLMQFVPCFLPGVLAFVISRRTQTEASPLLLFGLIIVAGVIGVPMLVASGLPEMPLLWGLCLVLGLTVPRSEELRNRHLVRGSGLVAKYSYGVYMTHVLALGAIDGLMPGPVIVQWAAMLILLPGLAYICYHCIEKRGVALGARLAARCALRSQRGEQGSGAGGEAL